MTDTTQPEALRLADLIHCGDDKCQCSFNLAAAELRRLHAQRDALMEVLKQIAGAALRADNLMSDKDIARAAIKAMEEKP